MHDFFISKINNAAETIYLNNLNLYSLFISISLKVSFPSSRINIIKISQMKSVFDIVTFFSNGWLEFSWLMSKYQ